jgi:hypothetical protein
MAGAHATTIHVSIRPEFPAVAWYARRVRILVLVGLLACGGPPAPAASGSLVFDPQPTSTADVFLATEAEVIRSAPLREHLRESRRLEIPADAITVTRKPGTMILEVGVRDEDPGRAAALCNELLRAYMDYRRERAVVEIMSEQKAVAEQLDRHRDDARLQERLHALEVARGTLEIDVRVLETCTPASRR